MKIGLHLFAFIISLSFLSCSQQQAKVVNTTERDTTITETNAFSNLFMDSARVEKYILSQQIDDSAASLLRNFYNSRNYQFAWFTNEGLTEQAQAFWNLHNQYVKYANDSSMLDKRLHQQMELLISDDTTVNPSSESVLLTELQLTEHFFQYAHYAYAGKVDPSQLQWHIPRKKLNPISLLDSLLANKEQNLDEWEPVNNQYRLMKKELVRYYNLEKKGGWGEIVPGEKKVLKEGDSSEVVRQVKERLRATGDYTLSDNTPYFTPELTDAVIRIQNRFGLTADGIVGSATINQLNVSVKDRIKQILVNMERMRWMPKEAEGNRIVANIPEFKLHVYENGKEVFDMDIVVGKAANRTVIFNDELKYVVFSPYWNVPRSIVRNEILPAMQNDPGYLSRKNMEQTGYSNGLPVIRQKPGGNNALGRVKFLFPNSYAIYFHDTPAKSLFNETKRAFSHGCIRLAQPAKMAEYLLRNKPGWTPEKIREAMYAGSEKWVALEEPVPVFISYFTSWVDKDGLLHFREDIYNHDKKLAERLFEQDENQSEFLD